MVILYLHHYSSLTAPTIREQSYIRSISTTVVNQSKRIAVSPGPSVVPGKPETKPNRGQLKERRETGTAINNVGLLMKSTAV